jgi:hypothetical protein
MIDMPAWERRIPPPEEKLTASGKMLEISGNTGVKLDLTERPQS